MQPRRSHGSQEVQRWKTTLLLTSSTKGTLIFKWFYDDTTDSPSSFNSTVDDVSPGRKRTFLLSTGDSGRWNHTFNRSINHSISQIELLNRNESG